MAERIEGLPREMIAMRVSQEIKDGDYVNLGIGIPTLVSNFIADRDIVLQSEIGLLKSGPLAAEEESDQDLINASCQAVLPLPGTVCCDIVDSFAMIRGGRMNVVVMGALQVNDKGDYAGWANPSRGLDVGNIGGSMDLCAGASRLILAMEHVTDKGDLKIVSKLSFPVTALGKVNMIITDLAVIEVVPEGLLLKEIFPGITVEQLQSMTQPKLVISPQLKAIEL
jgi:3-oxoacid CoA-transferase subunit B